MFRANVARCSGLRALATITRPDVIGTFRPTGRALLAAAPRTAPRSFQFEGRCEEIWAVWLPGAHEGLPYGVP